MQVYITMYSETSPEQHAIIHHCMGHTLEIDDMVITNWKKLMDSNCCVIMMFAVPHLQNYICEWRANWLGDMSEEQVYDGLQEAYTEVEARVVNSWIGIKRELAEAKKYDN